MIFKKITAIFPDGYPDAPTHEELLNEAEDRLSSSEHIPTDLVRWLRETECPFLREARAFALQEVWEQHFSTFDDHTGYYHDGCWCSYWPDYETSLRNIVRAARREQETNEAAAKSISPEKKAEPLRKSSEAEKLVNRIKKEVGCKEVVIKIENHFNAPVDKVINHVDKMVGAAI